MKFKKTLWLQFGKSITLKEVSKDNSFNCKQLLTLKNSVYCSSTIINEWISCSL